MASKKNRLAEMMNKLNESIRKRNERLAPSDDPGEGFQGNFERVYIGGDRFSRADPTSLSAPTSYLVELQKKMERDAGYIPTPRKKHTPLAINWQDFTFDLIDPNVEDAPRLEYWFDRWANTPTGVDGYGSRRAPSRIFFALLAENGMRREDFDWKLFRDRYFKLYPQQYSAFQENQRERKNG